jgi:hypothetical protein
VGGVNDLFIEFKNRILGGEQVSWQFFQVGVETHTQVGFFLFYLLNQLGFCHDAKVRQIKKWGTKKASPSARFMVSRDLFLS